MPGELKVAAAVTQGFSSHYPPEAAAAETSQEEGEKYSAQLCKIVEFKCQLSVADLAGARDGPLSQPKNVFIFMPFSGKIGQIIGWHPSGKSCICH